MADRPVLFRAAYRGRPVAVGPATEAELAALARAPGPAPRDSLDRWTLVAVRYARGRGTQVHALGWRTALEDTWITSVLTGVDATAGTVAARSGYAYKIGAADGPELDPGLREHLAYALRTWGFGGIEG